MEDRIVQILSCQNPNLGVGVFQIGSRLFLKRPGMTMFLEECPEPLERPISRSPHRDGEDSPEEDFSAPVDFR